MVTENEKYPNNQESDERENTYLDGNAAEMERAEKEKLGKKSSFSVNVKGASNHYFQRFQST